MESHHLVNTDKTVGHHLTVGECDPVTLLKWLRLKLGDVHRCNVQAERVATHRSVSALAALRVFFWTLGCVQNTT